MDEAAHQNLSEEAELALAHSRRKRRDALRIFFELDARISRIVAGTSEPMLGQMRLAWWRETLGSPIENWPKGDAVLDQIASQWPGETSALIGLVDAWEHLLVEPPLERERALEFVKGRSGALLAVFDVPQEALQEPSNRHLTAARQWVCADLAAKVSLEEERELFIQIATEQHTLSAPLPTDARGLAVLGALGRRAIKRGGRPLMEGRGAALTALRAAIVGR